ncbi:MAG TPA: sigma-70 family RNA polymerase sigma factor, partial [Phycisphaerales bacterium]|nr:sigma-70 family RNA polymerase sigma factor [Phycisphaerales bacterium]
MADHNAARRAIDAVWRIESPRIIAGLARVLRGDLDLAEEFAQEALLAATEQWAETGVPDNAGAWLMAAAKNKATDALRRRRTFRRVADEAARESQGRQEQTDHFEASDLALDGGVSDDLLRLVFTTCHPVLADESRTALTLRLLCGLSTDEIARAFLVPEPTIAQRIVRAKRTLAENRVEFEVPAGRELKDRLASVLEVIYLLFNEGYAATSGDDWMRPALCQEAIRLGRVLAGLMPLEAEVHALVALMEIQASRTAARVDAAGRPVLLLDQDRSKWDRLLIRHALKKLQTAESLAHQP